MQTIRLLIINNNQAVRRGLVSLFAKRNGFIVLDELESVNDFTYLQRLQPDAVLYGLNQEDEGSIGAICTIKETCPYTLVIVLSDFCEQPHLIAAIAAGTDGYLKTPILPADLVTLIELACKCGISFFPRAARESLLNLTMQNSKNKIRKPLQ